MNNWGVWTTKQSGFSTPAGTAAPWEDRSEIVAALMHNGDEPYLRAYCQRDPIIQWEVELMEPLLSEFCGPSDTSDYWDRAVAYLKTLPTVSWATFQ